MSMIIADEEWKEINTLRLAYGAAIAELAVAKVLLALVARSTVCVDKTIVDEIKNFLELRDGP